PEVVMTFAEAEVVGDDGTVSGRTSVPAYARGKRYGAPLALLLLQSRFYPISLTVVVRRDAVESMGGFLQPEGLPLADTPTWLKILMRGATVGVPSVMGAYRVHPASVCRTRTEDIDEAWMRFAETSLDEHWRQLGLSEARYERVHRSLVALNDHRRALHSAQHGDWPNASASFRRAFARGTPRRKLNAALSYLRAAFGHAVRRERLRDLYIFFSHVFFDPAPWPPPSAAGPAPCRSTPRTWHAMPAK